MLWYKRLRWQLVLIPLVVVVVGIITMLAATNIIQEREVNEVLNTQLKNTLSSEQSQIVEDALLNVLSETINCALLIAGGVAVVTGVLGSFFMWRRVVNPIQNVISASQRIASGNFSERVPIFESSGEALQQLSINFNRLAENLEQSEQNRVDMIGNIAHELKTPITGIRGLVEGLSDGIYMVEPDIMGRIDVDLQRMNNLVEDFRNLSQIQAGAFKLTFTQIDVNALCAEIVERFQTEAEAKNIKLSMGETQDVFAQGDWMRSAQVLTNLVTNALRYTPEGGCIHLSHRVDGKCVYIDVEDSGLGLHSEDLPHVFNRFYRVDPSRSRESGGTGIGLTIARNLAWAMGGSLSVFSSGLDQGSTFTFSLPIEERNIL